MIRVGFIGLGLMGKPMAKRLLAAQQQLVVFNRSRGPAEELAELGAIICENPKDLAESSDIVITMLPDSSDVKKVILGKDGVSSGVRKGGIVIDCSTISPLVEKEIAQQLSALGVEMLDAPVSGGTIGAEAGSLTFMVGGSRDVFEKCLPILEAMGKNVFYMGGSGMGSFTKLCNQLSVALTLLGTCEALLLASKAGLDPEKTIEVLATGAASSWQLVNLGPKMLQRDFKPGFKLEHLKKDLRLITEACEELNLPTLGSGLMHELLKATVNQGLGQSATPALILTLEQLANHEVKTRK